jgi:hypothetical protein
LFLYRHGAFSEMFPPPKHIRKEMELEQREKHIEELERELNVKR